MRQKDIERRLAGVSAAARGLLQVVASDQLPIIVPQLVSHCDMPDDRRGCGAAIGAPYHQYEEPVS
jgi:hypothetical protein